MSAISEITDRKEDISYWFDKLVSSIRTDELQLVTNIAPKDVKDFWKPFIEDNHLEIAKRSKESAFMLLIPDLLTDYIGGIKKREIDILSLSFQLSDSAILVWATVNDDDERAMDQLFLQEAEVNSKFDQYGLNISSTILEESDNCPTPPQFQKFI